MLSKFKNIFVDTRFDPNDLYPNEIMYNGILLYRFMDYFFLEKTVDNLTKRDIVYLCELRLKFKEKVINYKYNQSVVLFSLDLLSSCINDNEGVQKILDFGCGPGVYKSILIKRFPNSTIFGYDLSSDFLNEATKNGLVPIYNLKGVTIKFDLVVSFFVFHFNIVREDINMLIEKMENNSFLIFNIYGKMISTRVELLASCGLSLIKIVPFPENQKHYIAIYQKQVYKY